jgi:hypothetical protein
LRNTLTVKAEAAHQKGWHATRFGRLEFNFGLGMNLCNFKNRFLIAPRLRHRGIASLLLAISLAGQVFAEKKLNSVAVTVGDLGNPYFVQIAHGAQDQAKKLNPAVQFTAQSSNYDVNNQSNQIDNFIAAGDRLLILNAADSRDCPGGDSSEGIRYDGGRRRCERRWGRRCSGYLEQ